MEIRNVYGTLKDKMYVIVDHVVFIAHTNFSIRPTKGLEVIPWCGSKQTGIITDDMIKDAFIKKYGGRFRKRLYYPESKN